MRLFRHTSQGVLKTALLFTDALLAVQFSRTTGLAGPRRSPADKSYSTSPRATCQPLFFRAPSQRSLPQDARNPHLTPAWEEGRASPGYCRNSSGALLNARAL